VDVASRDGLPNVGENVQEYILTAFTFGTRFPPALFPTLTIHQELKNPENYNTQEPFADEAVLE
jgi:hypothetical protein